MFYVTVQTFKVKVQIFQASRFQVTLLSSEIVERKAPEGKSDSLLYLNTSLSYKAFIVSLQCQPQARRSSPKRRRANQQLPSPLFVTDVALAEHTWETHVNTMKTDANIPIFHISKATDSVCNVIPMACFS